MRNEIRIAKKFCTIVDTRYQNGYYIKMQSTSKYVGYHFYVSSYFCESCATYFAILKSNKSNFIFTLEIIDREPGKRYARPKLSFEELQAEFAEHSEQFYSDRLPQALAHIACYANNGTRNAGEVVCRILAVGGYDDTWFYVSDSERRRLNTKGVRILKVLEPSEATQIKKKLQRYDELRSLVYKYKDCHFNYYDWYVYKEMQRTLKPNVLSTIITKFDEINAIVATEAEDSRCELEELQKYFDAFLEASKEEEE
jgi:hypothetical protein